MSSRGACGRAPSRTLPPLVVVLLAALAVALGPAVGSGSLGALGSPVALVSPVGLGAPSAVEPPAAALGVLPGPSAHGRAGHPGDVPPTPSRAGVRHASPAGPGLERPTFHAVLPALAIGAPLAGPVTPGASARRSGSRSLSPGSARSPPAASA